MNTPLQSLQDSHFYLDRLLATTQEGYWLIDRDAVTIDVNPAMCRMLDRPREEIVGEKIFTFIAEEDRSLVYEHQEKRREGNATTFEVTFVRPDGSHIICTNNATPILDDDGTVVGALGLLSDITELKDSQRLYRDLIEGSAQGIMIHADFKAVLVNRRFAEIFGYDTPEDVLSIDTINHLIHPEDRQRIATYYGRRLAGEAVPETYEFRGVTKGGSPIWLSVHARLITWHGVPAIQATVLDVTDQVKSDRTLHDLYAAIEAMPEAVAVMDADDRFIFLNAAYRAYSLRLGKEITTGESYENHVRTLNHSGAFPAAVGREEEAITAAMARHINPGAPYNFTDKTGHHLMGIQKRLPSGGCVSLITDVTLLKNRELDIATARDEAERANRAKSEFLSSMSHELRTPMNSILGFAELLADDPDDPISERHKRFVDRISTNDQHLLELINQILDLSRIEAGKADMTMETIDVREMVEECLELTQPIAHERDIAVALRDVPSGVKPIRADRGALRQIILNLLSNAVKYNSDGGSISVAITDPSGGLTRISVADTGPGIPLEKQGQIFEPFNRLGMAGSTTEGSGIGLTISKKLTESMDGRIAFEPRAGGGSVFWVQFPSIREHARSQLEFLDGQSIGPKSIASGTGV